MKETKIYNVILNGHYKKWSIGRFWNYIDAFKCRQSWVDGLSYSDGVVTIEEEFISGEYPY